MLLHDAIIQALVIRDVPIVVDYDLFRLVKNLYIQREYDGERLKLKSPGPSPARYKRIVERLSLEHYLRPDPDFYPRNEIRYPSRLGVFRVSDVPDGTAEDITAQLDPFCYLSHLSAMQRFNLTNRIPKSLTLSTPKKWSLPRDRKLLEDFGSPENPDDYHPPLKQLVWPPKIRGRDVTLHKTVRSPTIKQIRGSHARIASVGEVFVQMLDRPELCGGMEHVIEVWENSAKTYIEEIITAVSASEEGIVKVRAGYLLEERLGVSDARLVAWTRFAQRGGSRKLDPRADYLPRHSEKWMISINV